MNCRCLFHLRLLILVLTQTRILVGLPHRNRVPALSRLTQYEHSTEYHCSLPPSVARRPPTLPSRVVPRPLLPSSFFAAAKVQVSSAPQSLPKSPSLSVCSKWRRLRAVWDREQAVCGPSVRNLHSPGSSAGVSGSGCVSQTQPNLFQKTKTGGPRGINSPSFWPSAIFKPCSQPCKSAQHRHRRTDYCSLNTLPQSPISSQDSSFQGKF